MNLGTNAPAIALLAGGSLGLGPIARKCHSGPRPQWPAIIASTSTAPWSRSRTMSRS
jgi:hypothetical protein